MLATLFGDLAAPKEASARAKPSGPEEDDEGFAPTAVMEDEPSPPAALEVRGQLPDGPDSHNLFVAGSPAQAIRDHFGRKAPEAERSAGMITLLDLSGSRAPGLLKALSDATGAPVERLTLREQATLRTLSVIERTTVLRRGEDVLKVYHADARGSGAEDAEVSAALLERSRLGVVLLEGASADLVTDTLNRLQVLARHSTWRCPMLALLLPGQSPALAAHVRGLSWPAGVRVEVEDLPARGPSALWNTILSLRERAQATPVLRKASVAESWEPQLLQRLLGQVLNCEGVLGCALVDGAAGSLMAGEVSLPPGLAPDLTRAALACSLALRAHQHAARQMGLPTIEEITVSAADHQQVIRSVASRPGLFLLALLDRRRANVALARFKLRDAEKSLG